MNLGFDAISQFPISQVAADNVVTITVTGNNLIANIGNPNIAADGNKVIDNSVSPEHADVEFFARGSLADLTKVGVEDRTRRQER